jgi:hypothetical protein
MIRPTNPLYKVDDKVLERKESSKSIKLSRLQDLPDHGGQIEVE